MDSSWTIAIDRGGTFTDIVAISKQNKVHVLKILSASSQYENSLLEGIHQICQIVGWQNVSTIKIGTTIATNALLENKGARVCYVTTSGFEDALEIGYQNRNDLFALHIKKTKPLYESVVAVEERISAAGSIIVPIHPEDIYQKLHQVYETGIRSLAITLQHSWRNPEHEKIIENIAQEIGFSYVFASYKIASLIKLVMRGQTTVINAYLHPLIHDYMNFLTTQIPPKISIQCMQSSGGITNHQHFLGKDAILSGPAGGVVAVEKIANTLGCSKAIGFDMGGTSTDVSRYCGKVSKVFETQINNVPFYADMLNINTIAAGGGSLLLFDGVKMSVGPESAGALPGPACYGMGGPLTITDANIYLGRIAPEYFPNVFGAEGKSALDKKCVVEKFTTLAKEINTQLGTSLSEQKIAEGFLKIANENMGNAIKQISTAEGFSLQDHILVCFGGAGAQHACSLAQLLNIPQIIIHPLSSVLSAYGIALAQKVKTVAQSILKPFTKKNITDISKAFEELRISSFEKVKDSNTITKYYIDMRVKGTDTFLTILWENFEQAEKEFASEYEARYGIVLPEKPLEIVNIRVEVTEIITHFEETKFALHSILLTTKEAIVEKQVVFIDGENHNVPVFSLSNIKPGNYLWGPAIITSEHTTILVEKNFKAFVNEYNHLVLELQKTKEEIISLEKDPVLLEIFNNSFQHIAEQMGFTLINTSHSTNIKERLDFSCALFDQNGSLIANAPHIPVHLGAMGETIKALLADKNVSWNKGDTYVSNDPFHGGSHLPDITVVTPYWSQDTICFFLACRGHHSDIGGITPGSMPSFSSSLEEEGVLIHNFKLVDKNKFKEQEICKILMSGKYPARNIKERISDLEAQIAANNRGIKELGILINRYGIEVVTLYTKYVRENATFATQQVIKNLLKDKKEHIFEFEDFMEDGARIHVKVMLRQEQGEYLADIDFSKTSRQSQQNINAPTAIVKACIIYVFRTLIQEKIPLNDGCFVPITFHVQPGSLLCPFEGAAVVGGNVETSQRIVDVLYGAFGVVAASQGTMNNFTFGKDGENGFGYYETICGGSGAGNGFNGASAVHTHMTNTRITDPEILEYRYPQVRLKKFSIRKNSGGKGKYRGGDGVVRQIEFLESCTVNILSERRSIPPYGLMGGQNGKRGKNTIVRANGFEQTLPAKVSLVVEPGEIITIYTPGGGGYGKTL